MDSERGGEREVEVIGFVPVSAQIVQVSIREKHGNRLCALHCDTWSGLGIQQAILGRDPDQPHQQELLRRVLREGGMRVVGARIVPGTENYLWGRLSLVQGDRAFTMECRAACAIAQAVRWGVPIMMDEHALRAANEHAHGRHVASVDEPSGLPS